MIRVVRVGLAWGAVLVGWVANSAGACPSCASPLEENRQAFVDTTIFLSLLPLAMVGGLIWWIRRKARQRDEVLEIPVHQGLLRDAQQFDKGR